MKAVALAKAQAPSLSKQTGVFERTSQIGAYKVTKIEYDVTREFLVVSMAGC